MQFSPSGSIATQFFDTTFIPEVIGKARLQQDWVGKNNKNTIGQIGRRIQASDS